MAAAIGLAAVCGSAGAQDMYTLPSLPGLPGLPELPGVGTMPVNPYQPRVQVPYMDPNVGQILEYGRQNQQLYERRRQRMNNNLLLQPWEMQEQYDSYQRQRRNALRSILQRCAQYNRGCFNELGGLGSE